MSTVEQTTHEPAQPLRYALLVLAPPYSQEASHSAIRFAQALLVQGHVLETVFFYHDGVYNAARMQYPPQDEPSIVKQWQTLGEESGASLQVCIAASIKRGITTEAEAKRYGEPVETLAPGFELAGLGQLVQATAVCDRVMTFA